MSFFEKLSKASVWQPILQPTNNLQPLTVDRRKDDTSERHRTQSVNSSACPTPGEATPSRNSLRNATPLPTGFQEADLHSTGGNTSIGTDDKRGTVSTQSVTQASRDSTSAARFSEVERLLQRKLQVLEVSGKKSSERLLSLEQQFNRIEDLNKNLAAVKCKLDNATEQMEQFNTTQTHISSDMSELKNNTAKQFTAINQRLLSNVESQDKISTTMLDLREHFEKMSAFTESLAHQMERNRQQSTSGTQSKATTASAYSFTAGGGATDSSSNSSASRTSSSSMSQHSLQSTASSTVYCSPEKKK